jgi:hypothetical protein
MAVFHVCGGGSASSGGTRTLLRLATLPKQGTAPASAQHRQTVFNRDTRTIPYTQLYYFDICYWAIFKIFLQVFSYSILADKVHALLGLLALLDP